MDPQAVQSNSNEPKLEASSNLQENKSGSIAAKILSPFKAHAKDYLQDDHLAKQEKKFRLLKVLVEVSLGLNFLVAGLLILLLVIIFDKRLDILTKNQTEEENISLSPQDQTVKIAQDNTKSPIFIHDQVFAIDKAFNSQPTKLKLTVNGQLKKEVFGYLPYWVIDRADEINIKLLTSVAYFGLEVGGDGEIVKTGDDKIITEAWSNWQSNKKLDNFIRKLKRNKTKALVTFKSFSRVNIERLLNSSDAQKTFINNVLYQVSAKAMDGVNIDFEYVGTPSEEIRDKFSIMISNLNKELKRQYPKSILTIATFASAASSNQLWDISLLAENSDGLVIMGYDFFTPHSSIAGPVAPMGGTGENLFNMINAFLEKAPSEKLILAVPYYGYDWPTEDRSKNSQVTGPITDVKALPYAEIIEATKKVNINWDEITQTPWYSYLDSNSKQNRIVHFENPRSLAVKYDLVLKHNLQGIGIWALGFDGRNTDLLQLIADKFAN